MNVEFRRFGYSDPFERRRVIANSIRTLSKSKSEGLIKRGDISVEWPLALQELLKNIKKYTNSQLAAREVARFILRYRRCYSQNTTKMVAEILDNLKCIASFSNSRAAVVKALKEIEKEKTLKKRLEKSIETAMGYNYKYETRLMVEIAEEEERRCKKEQTDSGAIKESTEKPKSLRISKKVMK